MESEARELVSMKARILRVYRCQLLVCDICNSNEVIVHTPNACCFRVGDCICIEYNGAMTMSLPPQISADKICSITKC